MSSLHEKPVDVLGHNSRFPDYALPRLPAMDNQYDSTSYGYPMSAYTQDQFQQNQQSMMLPPPVDHHTNQHSTYDPHTYQPYSSHPNSRDGRHSNLPVASSDFQQPPPPSAYPQVPRPAIHRAPASNYDDIFSDIQSTFDQAPVVDSANQPDAPSLEGDSKLLAFSAPLYPYNLLSYTYHRTSVALNAQLHGMFFLSESAYQNGEPTSPIELTCYRRNLFSISGSVTLPRSMRYIVSEQGEQLPIVAQELTLSATESVEGNSVKIISVPWKTPAGAQPSDDRPEKEPSSIALDLMAGAEIDPELATIPIQWKRLQFRIATANNGRRKELQQHFLIKLRVMATLSTGQRVSIAEITSNHVIVRGRSPRNFQSKKEVPVGQSTSGRKSQHASKPSVAVTTPTGSNEHSGSTPVKSEAPFLFDPSDLQMSPDFLDWKVPTAPASSSSAAAMSALPADTFAMPHGVNLYANSSPGGFNNRRSPPRPKALSLMDEEPRRPESDSGRPRKMTKMSSPSSNSRASASTSNGYPSYPESGDQTYEYFPLGMDDWQEPVDAVYRPHVVHHINNAAAADSSSSLKRKRYFSSEEQAP